MKFEMQQIGVVASPFKTKAECPIQGNVRPDAAGTVTVFPEFEAGLETIETFSHIILFYVFDRAGDIQLSRPTFLDDQPHGIFASRHPCRINGMGMSIVELAGRRGNVLDVRGIDVLDQTPLIDIKPYVPRFDAREKATNGWVGELDLREKPENRE